MNPFSYPSKIDSSTLVFSVCIHMIRRTNTDDSDCQIFFYSPAMDKDNRDSMVDDSKSGKDGMVGRNFFANVLVFVYIHIRKTLQNLNTLIPWNSIYMASFFWL